MARLPRSNEPTTLTPTPRDLKPAGKGKAGRDRRPPANPLRFERRREARETVEPKRDGSLPTLTGTYSDGQDRFGILHMELLDQSRCGLGVRSRTRVEPGMRVTICPAGSSVPWLTAVAVRCEPEPGDDSRHRIGLSLSPRFAA